MTAPVDKSPRPVQTASSAVERRVLVTLSVDY
jgi:hypothetical protein